ncbi:hypothetical protein P154DRAFT_576153 [Amniculicola lignicola CBS 123094]|uniref:Uncharacterized protein n=1 Tax=Amniculicola lignicola CBS 123094 TaxID=1392246 RepID=A0A6A5WGD2_9PLEO|nr:hypothetical protein P154DRAFT_576153 [Amniculicola lignicola CBS 123094]
MASKTKFFSWSKSRSSTAAEYYRTGGLLAIDSLTVGDSDKEAFLANEEKSTTRSGRPRPPNLNLTIPTDWNAHHPCLSAASAHHNAALVNSASNLLAVVNDMLRSPALGATLCPQSASIHKPLPSRPRSVSLPSSPNLPVELPGSILLENQGLPSSPVAGSATDSTMKSVRSGNALISNASPSAGSKQSPSKLPQHRRNFSENSLQKRTKSRPSLVASPSSTDSKVTACSVSTNGGHTSGADSTKARVGAGNPLQPSPLTVEGKPREKSDWRAERQDELGTSGTPTPTRTRSQHIEELKATITAQDNTISTLQSQFGSLRASHEAHVASLVDTHQAEVATLKNYTRALEEQQSQRSLHHASSNHLLLMLDMSEQPQSPNRESPHHTAGTNSANSIRSFKTAFEQPARSPYPRDSPEMDTLKRKLSAAKRPETGNPNLVRELNTYKQNHTALQKQIESLMSKLNLSMTREKNLVRELEKVEKSCTDWQAKASKVEQLEKTNSALQNTIDHLEYRLEMANCEKLDAEEALFTLQRPSPSSYELLVSKEMTGNEATKNRQSVRASMSTIFSMGASGSPQGNVRESRDPTTLAAFIAHIERLQEQIKEKDSRNSQLEQENEQLRQDYSSLEHEQKESSLQIDIQGQLLKRTQRDDLHVEQLRTAIIERESIIGDKEKALRMAERQLDHHKLLLQAEIRRHATMSLLADVKEEPLPDLDTLASKEDIDRWISRLQKRLKKDKKANGTIKTLSETEDLRNEIDFYVREIVYYKLDIKGYKSDIKRLKTISAKMGNYGNRLSELTTPSPSTCQSGDSPMRSRWGPDTPQLGISSTPSPVSTGPISASVSIGRPVTPPPDRNLSSNAHPEPSLKATPRDLELKAPVPQTPTRKNGINPANEADNFDPGISPRSIPRLSPERRKPTPPSPDQERFDAIGNHFPLSTPAAPKRHGTERSMSDSIIQLYATPRTPERSPASKQAYLSEDDNDKSNGIRERSGSLPDPNKGKLTPDRPPRPRYGLFETPNSASGDAGELRKTPRMNVLAEALRHSPDQTKLERRPQTDRKLSNTSVTEPRGGIPRPDSSGSGSGAPRPLQFRQRAGAASPGYGIPPSPPSRKNSAASGSSIPFVIAMGSPHNPALITPTTAVSPVACPITSKVQSPTSRIGVGGTMASSTTNHSPFTSPVTPTDTSKMSFFGSALPSPKKSGNAAHGRSGSLGGVTTSPKEKKDSSPRSAGGHARSISGSSIMSAMQLSSSLMRGKGKPRKDSISNPSPLASPFDIDRTSAGNRFGFGEGIFKDFR